MIKVTKLVTVSHNLSVFSFKNLYQKLSVLIFADFVVIIYFYSIDYVPILTLSSVLAPEVLFAGDNWI